jgi:hypothetical protein
VNTARFLYRILSATPFSGETLSVFIVTSSVLLSTREITQ